MPKDSRLKLQENGYYYFDKVIKGKRIRKSLKTKKFKEAQRLADELEAEYKFGKKADLNGNIKVKDFIDIYFQEKTKEGLTPNTIHSYKGTLKRFNKSFGNRNMADITPKELQIYLNNLSKPNGEKLSKKTLSKTKDILNNFFKMAMYVEYQYITINPMTPVRIPKDCVQTEKKNMYIPPEVVDKIFELSKKKNYGFYTVMSIQYFTGMRISEVLGLTWDSIDFENKVIHLTKQLYTPKGSKKNYSLRKLKADKNGEKNRDIQINDYLINILKNQRLKQMENRLKYGQKYKIYKDDFVCTYPKGTFINYQNIYYFYKTKIRKELGEKYSSHYFRHTNITDLMHNPNLSKEAIKQRVGHNSIDMTEYYTEYQKEADQKIADYTEELSKNLNVKILSK